mmetsp:Transcript_44579/g.135917  ORF Transcript_44579/g.135917 Transcript_44579/m.135917 type:complete len:84 (-) Transcript_44579:93-344(-)
MFAVFEIRNDDDVRDSFAKLSVERRCPGGRGKRTRPFRGGEEEVEVCCIRRYDCPPVLPLLRMGSVAMMRIGEGDAPRTTERL